MLTIVLDRAYQVTGSNRVRGDEERQDSRRDLQSAESREVGEDAPTNHLWRVFHGLWQNGKRLLAAAPSRVRTHRQKERCARACRRKRLELEMRVSLLAVRR